MVDPAPTRQIVIRHLAGSAHAGTTRAFAVGIVSIGRGEGNELAFDPLTDRQVSARHARISRRDSGLFIVDLGSTNGTYVNGRRINAETPIGPRDVIRLGESGPEFAVSAGEHESSMIPGTLVQAGGGRADGGGGVVGSQRPRGGPIRVPVGQPGRARGGSVTGSASPERRGGRRFVLAIAMLIMIGGVVYAWLKGHLSDFEVGPLAPSNQRSVYLVFVETPQGGGTVGVETIGTAWAVGPGVLATNAHVVESVASKLAVSGARAFARSNTEAIVDLTIESWEAHPGYAMFTEWMVSGAAGRVQREGPLPNPFDVGLLRVQARHAMLMEKPLILASDAVLHRMRQGMEVTTLGFPMEGLLGRGTDETRPVASFRRGSLDKMTDAFLGRSDSSEAFTLSYQFEITGGASGSPVFDGRGRVIGLVAAGNVVGRTDRGRVAVGGTTLGPRADILREMIDGTASTKMSRREADWRRRFEHWGKG